MANNIFNGWHLCGDNRAIDDTTHNIFDAFDYNFLGGAYEGRHMAWAFVDRHNIYATDTIHGDTTHQVWNMHVEPDWIVPDTSPAYQSGLDLSDSFMLRGVKYGPLPGMTPGYFPGVKPNLGVVQGTGYMGTPQRNPRRGSVTQPAELAFAPNPATGRYVTARCAIPTGKVGKLTLRDVVGRTVKSALVPSGVTQLDLRGFAPGIYIAALDAAGPAVSRKLIITAH
jgi:hypothetical protein